MAKNIVFCADGTWNGDSEAPDDVTDPTNVLKIFSNLDGVDAIGSYRLADEQERTLQDFAGNVVQIAKYLHGVGDSDNLLVKFLGGAIGAGLITRVIRGYTFLSRNYQSGDKIFLIGFSRGAYTVRALAGLIEAQGLLNPAKNNLNDPATAYKLGTAVWYAFRRSAVSGDLTRVAKLEDMVSMLPGFFRTPVDPAQLISNVPIDSVAVWETVGSMGIPQFANEPSQIDALRFVDTQLSSNVSCGFHAISIDEQRINFPPTLWDQEDRVVQSLFPGAHADVGGGYPTGNNESGLSDGALLWMMTKLATRGLIFSTPSAVIPAPLASGTAHAPWQHQPWSALGTERRLSGTHQFCPGLALNQSALDRINSGPVVPDPALNKYNYAPPNLDVYVGNCTQTPLPGITVD
jgi:uncharacterized protein (DUF2235 family)